MSATTLEEIIIAPQPGPQTEFLSTPADFCIYGGAAGGGKSYGLLLEPLRHVNNPRFGAVIFRQSFTQITEEGALWDTAEEIYPYLGATSKKASLDWIFASGAKVGFAHLGGDSVKFKYQGAQIPLICFDELTHFSESSVFYLLSRNRSTCGVKPYIRATTNPDADSWIAEFIDWWIDEEGFPIPERSGVLRWWIRNAGEVIWASDPDWLRDRFPTLKPKSFTFIRSTIHDNRILLDKDPDYLGNLQSLHPIDRARLLEGNWKIKNEAGKVFNRTWFEVVDHIPEGGQTVRFWDLAATERDVRSNACYTAGVKLKRLGEDYFICDVIAEQVGPSGGDQLLLATAKQDGLDVWVRWELEGGSAGKRDEAHIKQLLRGFNAAGVKPLGDKVKRAKPLATDAFHGKVKVLRAPWTDQFLSWMHGFPEGVKDITDAASGAHAVLNTPTAPPSRVGRFTYY